MNGISAFIFDMDDTLAATSGLWRRAETEFLESLGYAFTQELASHYKGMNALDVAATMHRLLGIAQPVEWCQQQLRERLFEAFRRGPLTAMPGADACLQRVRQAGPVALASGSPLELIEMTLAQFGWRDAFTVVISSESVPRGKPSPDVFLAAAAALGKPAVECLVFEDSLVGVQAALNAEMACFAVPSSHPAEIAQRATRVFSSLGEVTVEDWIGLRK